MGRLHELLNAPLNINLDSGRLLVSAGLRLIR
jgi:hypothetical protein